MTKTEYRKARRLVRDNGRYALRWLNETGRAVFEQLMDAPMDRLAERADIVQWCHRNGVEVNPRQTA